ncbi:MAG: UDP-N-acetylglucosamine 2-epimerase [Muribaculaceae bacterium]
MSGHRVCILTGTRADWGILMPLAEALRDHPDIELSVVATNMHLSQLHGMTVNEIIHAGFSVDFRVPMHIVTDDAADRVAAMGQCMTGMTQAFSKLKPDAVIILGDRFEMLASATAATMMRIPIIHIAGGTVSFGAVDDAIRHAITKLSSLHLVETDEHRHRVIQMGEDPSHVITAGALGVWNIMNRKLLSVKELADSLDGFTMDRNSTILVTYHPATLDDTAPADSFRALLDALDAFPDSKILISGANNDAGGMAINAMIDDYAASNPERVKAVKSLGMQRFLSAMSHAAVFVGNSSSGIVEAPSMGLPTVDIGNRQKGRQRAASVIHCEGDTASIIRAIKSAFTPEVQAIAAKRISPYYRPDTRQVMLKAILEFLNTKQAPKTFNDLEWQS